MAHTIKLADGLVRLVEFASGRSDWRPDKGAAAGDVAGMR
jgi:hypothetical protein